MKLYPRVVLFLLLVVLFSVSSAAWCSAPIKDGDAGIIGWCLSDKADSETVTLTCEQVMWRGMSGKSFAIKEWTEKWPEGRPRLLVVSTRPLPVESWWTVDVTGTMHTLTSADVEQRPRHTALYPEGIDQQYGPSNVPPAQAENPCYNWRYKMPPYHNLRVHGNPWSTYLSP